MTVWELPPPPPPLVQTLASVPSQPALPLPVVHQLEQLFRGFPELKQEHLAQLGPVKPEQVPRRKPTDPSPTPPPPPVGLPLSVKSDRQEYDLNTQTFTAIGNVVVQYAESELKADRVTLNLATQDTQAKGNVFFRRGNQTITGAELNYNYVTQNGSLSQAAGFVDLATLTDPNPRRLPADIAPGSVLVNPVAGEVQGGVRRIGFTADRLVLLAGAQWVGENLRVTNDPFSPPELELITSKATLTPLTDDSSELTLEAPTLGLDRVFFLPVPVNRIVLDQFRRPFPATVGYDLRDRGGAFYQQNFDVVINRDFTLSIGPQLLFQRALERPGGLFDRDILGLVVDAQADLGDRQILVARASFSGLDFSNLEKNLRANVRYSRLVFDDHNLSISYAFRDRFFNGSLGFQEVSNLVGGVITSPTRVLGDSGISLTYQAGIQLINSDRADLTPIIKGTLGRLQSAVTVSRSFNLAKVEPLPAERASVLRFSPNPIVPSLDVFVGVSGVYSFYTNGASQGVLSATVGLATVVGNFAKDFFDYTGVSVSVTQSLVSGQSPFFFDRVADQRILTAQLLQQVIGPVRVGFSQSWNLDTGIPFNATYSLQYDRRTYAVIVRYNPNQGLGELLLRISDFNWTDPPSPVTEVQGGIERQN
ncbi:MAG: DUF3769 domain-containing protein [Pseudanabaenaceae cyanobacterium]